MQAPLLQRKWLGRHVGGMDVVMGCTGEPKNAPFAAGWSAGRLRAGCKLRLLPAVRQPLPAEGSGEQERHFEPGIFISVVSAQLLIRILKTTD